MEIEMVRIKSKLNNASSEVIERNILQENPEGLPHGLPDARTGLVMASYIPEMRRIMFVNDRDPGCPLEFHFHSKTHPLKQYILYHGKEYTLPLEIIDHLESCSIPSYGYRKGTSDHPEMFKTGVKYNFRCKEIRNVA